MFVYSFCIQMFTNVLYAQQMFSFSSAKDMNSIISADDSGDPSEHCLNQSSIGEKDLELEVACSDLIADLEVLVQQPRKRKRDYSQTKISKASCCLPRGESRVVLSKTCAEDHLSSLHTASSSAAKQSMPIIEINLSDFVNNLQSRKNWKKSYLTGRFRVDEVTGDIEPVIKTRCKDHHCRNERKTLLKEKAILKMNLSKNEQCITGLSRQHTQILKVFNKKDKEIESLKQQLKGILKINSS
jgi:hypothetical protein